MTEFCCDLTAPTHSNEHAVILMRSLSVDRDLFPERSSKKLSVEGSNLKVHFRACDAKQLRTIVSSFLDLLQLTYQALQLGEEFEQ
ncbi:putative EKC/KEOPS complex subunit PCC1/LAGE3 [Monocercomonoides exilis]|uniref:putative EKC/KEOPS complex subunit PCC1/LAGE3 n=1 Tax=Monocercomonoides exilis TaxID=2049356 RepID=UPI00355A127F|nr:putative EKC/KEOPS complex subunit PCC1/LAGE3 [Monocercomonoides exilis]